MDAGLVYNISAAMTENLLCAIGYNPKLVHVVMLVRGRRSRCPALSITLHLLHCFHGVQSANNQGVHYNRDECEGRGPKRGEIDGGAEDELFSDRNSRYQSI
ncbi:hypothetical protein V6N13_134357 [Hibiscus sabdariffa]|uniref:Uncharacterized protein n=1 Tax=Hibiscus sabdariffa TaxID=183260 RepID=A0ABR2R438_9ROSI